MGRPGAEHRVLQGQASSPWCGHLPGAAPPTAHRRQGKQMSSEKEDLVVGMSFHSHVMLLDSSTTSKDDIRTHQGIA